MSEELKKLAKQYFESYPEQSTIHFSSDNQAFFQSNYGDGVNHQKRLDESKKLTTISRKDIEEKANSQDDETPSESTKNADIAAWLVSKGITDLTGKETKAVLLEKVKEVLASTSSDGNEGDNE
jgi:hypothetical protein